MSQRTTRVPAAQQVVAALSAAAQRHLAAAPARLAEFGGIDTPLAWRWLLQHAWPVDADLRTLLPVPPHALVARTAGSHADDLEYHLGGLVDLSHVYERFALAGAPFPHGRVLDFGCGAGRLLRSLAPFAARCELHGADVDAEALAWAGTHLPWATWTQLAMQPPSPFPAAHFDTAYALAVLSQLAEPLQRAWLRELARVLRPAGLLVVTTHGRACAARFAAGSVAQFSFPPAARVAADLDTFAADGHLFYAYPPEADVGLPVGARGVGLHGVAFVTPEHVRRHWLADFDLVAHVEAARGFQDEIVLRRR